MLFAAATTGAALTDGLTHASTRPLATALVEGLPALVLGVVAAVSARRGARLFGLAMLVLACGIVATSSAQVDEPAMVLAALLAVGVLLAAAFLRSVPAAPNRRRSVVISLLIPVVALAGLLTAVASFAWASLARTKCGVDNCAWTGLGIGFALGAACELTLLAVLLAALGADLRAGAGSALFAIGLNLLLVVTPARSQYQGVAGVAIGYTGLGMAALSWFVPRRAKRVNVAPSG